MTEAIEKRLAELRGKLKARTGKNYASNRVAIEAEIARLEAMLVKPADA